jgi:hypothetical protein
MSLGAAPRIMIVAGLCAAALIGLVASEGIARDSGQEVILPMAAVDPRAILSGHYVIIDLREPLAAGEPCPEAGGDWLALTSVGPTQSLAGSAPSRQEALEIAPIPVEGAFTCSPPTPDGVGGFVSMNLGVDRFYVNQQEAQRIEGALRNQQPGKETRVFAIVSIGRDGNARLRGLQVDGQRLELSWL